MPKSCVSSSVVTCRSGSETVEWRTDKLKWSKRIYFGSCAQEVKWVGKDPLRSETSHTNYFLAAYLTMLKSLGCAALNGKTPLNNELERMRKETPVVLLGALSLHLPERSEANPRNFSQNSRCSE
jgi:hypothetical protein